jgi:hypothetical protein
MSVTISGTNGITMPVGSQSNASIVAWANFNASGTLSASYNVTSVTKNSTGRWTLNFTNALADTNYATVYTPYEGASNGSIGFVGNTGSYTTTAVSVGCNQASNGAAYDSTKNCVAVFR